jgi:hypothetical protein
MKRLLFASLFIATLMPVCADDSWHTNGFTNGLWWVSRGTSAEGTASKIAYLAGLQEGMRMDRASTIFTQTQGVKTRAFVSYETGDITGEKLAHMVDSFYADPANIRVPVSDVLLWVHFKLAGEPPEFLNNYMDLLRVFNEPQSK